MNPRLFGLHRNYYAEVWVRHADWKEAEFFDELPAHLRGEVAGYLMEDVFEQSDFFRLAAVRHTSELVCPYRPLLPCMLLCFYHVVTTFLLLLNRHSPVTPGAVANLQIKFFFVVAVT